MRSNTNCAASPQQHQQHRRHRCCFPDKRQIREHRHDNQPDNLIRLNCHLLRFGKREREAHNNIAPTTTTTTVLLLAAVGLIVSPQQIFLFQYPKLPQNAVRKRPTTGCYFIFTIFFVCFQTTLAFGICHHCPAWPTVPLPDFIALLLVVVVVVVETNERTKNANVGLVTSGDPYLWQNWLLSNFDVDYRFVY